MHGVDYVFCRLEEHDLVHCRATVTTEDSLQQLEIDTTLVEPFTGLCTESIYCRVPARWGLQQTTSAPGSDETIITWARDPLVR